MYLLESSQRGLTGIREKSPHTIDSSLTHCIQGNCSCFFLSSVNFLQNYLSSFKNTIRTSNSLDPDQARRYVWPDLGPNCLPRLSAEDTAGQRVKTIINAETFVIPLKKKQQTVLTSEGSNIGRVYLVALER